MAEKRQYGGYICTRCGLFLDMARLMVVENADDSHIDIVHGCSCSEHPVRGRYPFSPYHLIRLFGQMPRLPWRCTPALDDIPEDHPDLVYWRWELEQLADAGEFERLCLANKPLDMVRIREDAIDRKKRGGR